MPKNLSLTRHQIDVAIAGLTVAVEKYRSLQASYQQVDIANDSDFQRKFNGYYRIRRGQEWRASFYDIFQRTKSNQREVAFEDVLIALHSVTRRLEASFASKLVGTVRPEFPIIDSVVLKHLGLRLPWTAERDRIPKVINIYKGIAEAFDAYLQTDDGGYLVQQFRAVHGAAALTEVKMLDFVVWATRDTVTDCALFV